jgi:CubicO group peptidase (beta-lactamase class C family)
MKTLSTRFKRIASTAAIVALIALAGAYAYIYPALRTGAGTIAHQLCSQAFVSGLPDDVTRDELLPNLVGLAMRISHYNVDRNRGTVDASLLGVHAHGAYIRGWGCRLDFGEPMQVLSSREDEAPVPLDDFAPEKPVITGSDKLAAALDNEFTDSPGVQPRHVKAVVIVKDEHIVAERYAQSFGVDTLVMSFSVSKSFTNALLAILVRQGRIDMNKPIAIREWQTTGDPRAKLLPDDLLRMASGLDAKEGDSGLDPANQMFYNRNDMAGYAASRQLKEAPGSEWEYTSMNTLLLDRVIGDTIGGGPQGVRDFAQRELFGPLHMHNVTTEFDGAGTFVGASHLYATPRDFARFGQLYLNDGVTPAGQRILPEGWVAYSRKSTLGTSYGAGFWTNDGSSEFAAYRVARGFPKDGFFASGNLGQRIYIVPSAHLVMVRFGYSKGPTFGMAEDLHLIKTALEETRGKGS